MQNLIEAVHNDLDMLIEENQRLRELLERAKGQLILTPGQRKSPLVREIEKELADAVGSQD